MVVGSSPGGGYDTYARLLARHFGSAIPGNPTVVVQNMSGAGSNRAAGYIYSVAPKDGTAIGAIFPGAVLQPLLSDVPVQHDPNKLVYLGSANSDVYVCYVRSDAAVKTFKDVLDKELIIGASNPGATTYDLPLLLNNVLGTKFRIVTGYPGSREITHRARARRGSGRLRHRLDRHRGAASGMVRQGHDPRAGPAQHQRATTTSTSATCRGPATSRAAKTTER